MKREKIRAGNREGGPPGGQKNAKAPAIVGTGANRRIEELIRDHLLKEKA
jgi:hypothetical protein